MFQFRPVQSPELGVFKIRKLLADSVDPEPKVIKLSSKSQAKTQACRLVDTERMPISLLESEIDKRFYNLGTRSLIRSHLIWIYTVGKYWHY